MQVPKERVKVLDRLRGLSIVYMLVGHMFLWTLAQEIWWFYSTFAVHDFLGGPMFVFVSGAGMTLSMRRHPETPAWGHHLRSLLILGVGVLGNLAAIGVYASWGWSILVALGVFRLIGYYAMKLRPWARLVLIGVIIGVARPLLVLLVGNIFSGGYGTIDLANPGAADILAYILYSFPHQNTIFPYLAFFLAGTLFVDLVIGQPQEKQRSWRHIFLVLGIILVSAGIIVGLTIWTNIDLGDGIFYWLAESGRFITEIPSLGSRNSLAWSLLMLGTQFLFALMFLKLEKQMYRNRFLTVYGEFSLTIYAANGFFFLVTLHTLPFFFVLPCTIFVIILTWYLCSLWYKKNKGKYSIEWMLNYVANFLHRHIEHHVNSRNGKSGLQPQSTAETQGGNNINPPLTEKPLPDASKDP